MGIKLRTHPRFRCVLAVGTNAGQAANGGKLYTYSPGTTDNKQTFTDQAGTTPHANPIVLDAQGEAVIWWKGSYDLKLDDSADVQQWTLSNYGDGEDTTNFGNYNKITDGGFEDDTDADTLPDQWSVTAYPTGGSGAGVVVIDTTDQIEGAQSLKFTSSGDGGGYAESAFFEVSEGSTLFFSWQMKSSAADVRNVVEIIWYTSAQVSISTSSLYDDSTTNPTSWTEKTASATVVSTARYAKVRVTGCHSSDSTTGSTWFDHVVCADIIQSVVEMLGYTPVDVAGDTMTGALDMNGLELILDVDADTSITSDTDDQIDFKVGAADRALLSSTKLELQVPLNELKGADIASASSIDIGAATGNIIDITGTTTITALGTVQAGTKRTLQFDGALTLTYNATSLILPTNANITTAAGDVAEFVSLGSGNWICTHYQKDTGLPPKSLALADISDSGSLAALSLLTEAYLDWANSDGITQWDYGNGWGGTETAKLAGNVDADTWYVKYRSRIYIPANANSITGVALVHRNPAFGWPMEMRLNVNAVAGTATSNDTGTYASASFVAFDVSALNGWITVTIEYRTTSPTSAEYEAYMDSAALRFI